MFREKLIKALREKKHERREGYVGCSEIGSCPLEPALRLKGFKGMASEKSILTMNVGTCIHEGFQKTLSKVLDHVEVELHDEELKLSGHPDGVFANDKEQNLLTELKSISPWQLKHYSHELPQSHHVVQTTALCWLFSRQPEPVHIDGIHYVYLNKLDGEPTEITVAVDLEEDFPPVKKRVTTIHRLAKKDLKKITLRDIKQYLDWKSGTKADVRPWNCRYCFQSANCPLTAEVEKHARALKEK